MRKSKIVCLVAVIISMTLTTGAVLAGKPQPPAPPPFNCKWVLCAYPDCLPNEHTEIPAGQCCPVCVPN
jgi:hypothetical protein